MGIKLSNNAFATLAAGINSSATSITVTTGQGARFPTLSAGDYFYATLIDTSNNLEIVKCTARATDVLTVTRAQESTTARAYSAGDRIEIRLTAQTFLDGVNGQDGDKGDITVSGTGTTWTIDNNAVTTAKINDSAITKAKMGFAGTVLQAGNVPALIGRDTVVDTATMTTLYTLSITPSKTNTRILFYASWMIYIASSANYASDFRILANGSTVLNGAQDSHNPYFTGLSGGAMLRGAGMRSHDPGTTSAQSYAFQFSKSDASRAAMSFSHNSEYNASMLWMEVQI
jgi:hypothetical protein